MGPRRFGPASDELVRVASAEFARGTAYLRAESRQLRAVTSDLSPLPSSC